MEVAHQAIFGSYRITQQEVSAPRTRPESHSLTQNEIFAHYPIAKKSLCPSEALKFFDRAKLQYGPGHIRTLFLA
jgi:hypothetical protein